LPPLLFFIGILLVWEFLIRYLNYPEFLIPSPTSIYKEFIASAGMLGEHFAITLIETLAGFALGGGIGIILGILMVYYKTFERIVYPVSILIKVAPIISIAPILHIWFGFGIVSKIIITAIISFFPLVINTSLGLTAVDPSLIDLMKSISAPERTIFFKIRLHNSLPYLFSGSQTAIIASIVGVIVAEFAGSLKGMGFLALLASAYIETPLLFVVLIILSLTGAFLFGLISIIKRIVIPWKPE